MHLNFIWEFKFAEFINIYFQHMTIFAFIVKKKMSKILGFFLYQSDLLLK